MPCTLFVDTFSDPIIAGNNYPTTFAAERANPIFVLSIRRELLQQMREAVGRFDHLVQRAGVPDR